VLIAEVDCESALYDNAHRIILLMDDHKRVRHFFFAMGSTTSSIGDSLIGKGIESLGEMRREMTRQS
jgi:hypothetical protein